MVVINNNTLQSGRPSAIGDFMQSANKVARSAGRQTMHGTVNVVSGQLRQTEAYNGYVKTVRPAISVAQAGAAVIATMSSMQLKRDYKRYNKTHGEAIKKYVETIKTKKGSVGEWDKGVFSSSRMNSNIKIATAHSRMKLAKDAALRCYRYNPSKARRQAKQLDEKFFRKASHTNKRFKSSGKRIRGLKKIEGVVITPQDLRLQVAGKKAMAAQGAKNIAKRKRSNVRRSAQHYLTNSLGITKEGEFAEGYQTMSKMAMPVRAMTNRMTVRALGILYNGTKKVAKRAVKHIGIQTLATGVHAYNSIKAMRAGTKVKQPKNLKTAVKTFRRNHASAVAKTNSAINNRITKPINNVKQIPKKLLASARRRLARKFIDPVKAAANRLRNTLLGKVVAGAGKALGLLLKPFLSLFRGLSAVFSTISSFLSGVAFAYVVLFGLVMAGGSLLSGVFGIFDSIADAAKEIWANTEPNVDYAVREIQEESRHLSNSTKFQENLAVISSVIDNLPITQLWHKLTGQETKTCAGYEIIVIGEKDYCILEIPSADNTINIHKIPIKKNVKDMPQENDREILSIVSNLYESYGGISNTLNISKQIEKSKWAYLVQILYVLSHNTTVREVDYVVKNYSVNYWTGEQTETSSTKYYKWIIEVEILRGTEFFNACGHVALSMGKEIDPDIEVTNIEELLEWYIASMEKDELWDEDSDIKYKGYVYSYFDNTDGILAQIAKYFRSTPQSETTYEYSKPPDDVYVLNSDKSGNSVQYVKVIQNSDGTYDTTGVIYKAENGVREVDTVFTPDNNGNPNKKEQEIIEKYLEEKGLNETTTDSSNSTNNAGSSSGGSAGSNKT